MVQRNGQLVVPSLVVWIFLRGTPGAVLEQHLTLERASEDEKSVTRMRTHHLHLVSEQIATVR